MICLLLRINHDIFYITGLIFKQMKLLISSICIKNQSCFIFVS
ncbi:hypothetical protein HMPREF1547_03564 [Blautia sp. KLE 1732]|nr:hypothetical protein HMPREF1547_03564 [Blautia sp. KLE 1732]